MPEGRQRGRPSDYSSLGFRVVLWQGLCLEDTLFLSKHWQMSSLAVAQIVDDGVPVLWRLQPADGAVHLYS